MVHRIIKAQNFADIENMCTEKRASVLNSYAVDRWANYGVVNFCVLGEDALQMFRDQYGAKLNRYAAGLKTDGKTSAKLLPYFTPEYYFDARRDASGLVGYNDSTEIKYLIEFDGVLFDYYMSGKTAKLYLYNDTTDYYNYLPYNWDKINPAPNNIGVITDKKLSDWKTYLLNRKNTAEAEKNRRENSAAAFLAKIKSFDHSGCKTYQIGETSGRIVCNGLEYTYNIANGVVNEKISVHYSAGKFDSFVKMINGEF